MSEQILSDLHVSDPAWKISLLSYFNPMGARESGLNGEDPQGMPNNLMPFVGQVAVGKRAELQVYGNEYPTPHGTGVRDYIHVVDLAIGHVKALERPGDGALLAVNLDTGQGYCMLDMVCAFEKASGRKVPGKIVVRRPGDIGSVYADPALALETFAWRAERGIDEMCRDGWKWPSMNPVGFQE